ncbi:MAG: hypothetical protein ACFHWX_11205 [Bacteroidota bacterium]
MDTLVVLKNKFADIESRRKAWNDVYSIRLMSELEKLPGWNVQKGGLYKELQSVFFSLDSIWVKSLSISIIDSSIAEALAKENGINGLVRYCGIDFKIHYDGFVIPWLVMPVIKGYLEASEEGGNYIDSGIRVDPRKHSPKDLFQFNHFELIDTFIEKLTEWISVSSEESPKWIVETRKIPGFHFYPEQETIR